ncbi:MAG: recombinase family protein [Desulfuromusa sp.]|nr:recombinase family protein [Desulfuromusa sp.]
MAIIGYARVSTIGQSLSAQTDQLENHGIDKLFKEKVSGVKKDRPQLMALLDYVREGDTVVVTKIDRIARSTKHLLEIVDTLKDKGIGFRVLNIDLDIASATGKMMLTMLSGIATFEREMMLERQAEGIAIAKAQGRYKGRKPTARAKAATVVSLASEGLTRQAIADQLEIGIASVYRILKSRALTSL